MTKLTPNESSAAVNPGSVPVDATREAIARQREAELAKRHYDAPDNLVPKGK